MPCSLHKFLMMVLLVQKISSLIIHEAKTKGLNMKHTYLLPSCHLVSIRIRFSCIVFLSFIIFMIASNAYANKRMALVIGNQNYPTNSVFMSLNNPHNDAKEIASTLQELGFSVHSLGLDLTKQQMVNAIELFAEVSKKAEIRLVYYSGHGVRGTEDNLNYLIPVGVALKHDKQIAKYGISTNFIVNQLNQQPNGSNIIILDACRNKMKMKGAEMASLGRMDAPKGTLVAYASRTTAADGPPGGHGVFTEHLLNELSTPGIEVRDMLLRVRRAVVRDTDEGQIPWTEDFLVSSVYLYDEARFAGSTTPKSHLNNALDLFTEPVAGISFVRVKEGCFRPTDLDTGIDSKKICVDGFWIGKYEVTNKQYRRFKKNHVTDSIKSVSPNNDDSHPVGSVSWEDANEFATWLSILSPGYRYRLPTPFEWEYAAKGGTSGWFYWGEDASQISYYVAMMEREFESAPVGSRRPNPFGLYDMIGNVWEWVDSKYVMSYILRRDTSRPNIRCYRYRMGGSYECRIRDLRIGTFANDDPAWGLNVYPPFPDFGFRLIMEKVKE